MADRPLQPETIHNLLDAVYPSFALLAGMQLDLFTPLADRPMRTGELASVLNVPKDKLGPLLYALVAAGLLTVENGRFANTPEAQRFLVRTRPDSLQNAHELLADLWHAGLQAADSIRTGEPRAAHDFSALSEDRIASFLRGLHPEALETGRLLAQRYDLSAHRSLLDVGGGSGGLAIALVETHPQLRAAVAELPEVVPVTKHFIEQSGVPNRIRVLASDITRNAPPGTYDLAVLKSFVQTLPPDRAQRALANVAAALEPGGSLYILGYGILDNTRYSPPQAALFNLVFLSLYDGGRAYTEREYRAWLEAAGLERIERTVLSDGSGIIAAGKPG